MAPAESFQQVFREVGQYSENLVTFATATGFLVLIILALKVIWAIVQGEFCLTTARKMTRLDC